MRTIIRNNYDPKTSDYHETIVIDDERNKKYVFDCDGVFTDFTNPRVVSTRGNSEDFAASQKWVTEIDDKVDGLADDLGDEIQARTDADDAIWAEIEEIEMSSDVVDIVGTYAELQQYDTSTLHNNDIIKVLSDETHQGETAYYRFSTSTSSFSYVGSEGPYYTESEVDTLLDGKQDTLIAGNNIQIAADGKTISATDTTYTAGAGIDITSNSIKALSVISVTFDSPSAGYAVLKSGTTVLDDMNVHNYIDRFGADVILAVTGNTEYATLIGELPADADGIHYLFEYGHLIYDFAVGLNGTKYTVIDTQAAMTGASAGAAGTKGLVPTPLAGDQDKYLKADGTWATITVPTYSDFTGATASTAGTHGLVLAPAAGDQEKFLKGDGTWGTVATTTIFYTDDITDGQTTELYSDSGYTTQITYGDLIDALTSGPVGIFYDNSVYYVVNYYVAVDPDWGTGYYIIQFRVQSAAYTGWVFDVLAAQRAANVSLLTSEDSYTLPTASASTAGIAKLYTTTGQNTNGAVTQKLFTDTVGNIETALQILNSGAGVP